MNKEVYIIGGGPSLKDFDFSTLAGKDTIAVNAAAFDVPAPNYFITVDFSFLSKINVASLRKINCKKIFVADFSKGSLVDVNGQITDIVFNIDYDLDVFDTIIKAKRCKGFGYSSEDFRTGLNSGYCALQLAIILGYKEIYLLGFDLQCSEQTHYHSLYTTQDMQNKLNKFLGLFEAGLTDIKLAKPNIHIYSCSRQSRLNKIIEWRKYEK